MGGTKNKGKGGGGGGSGRNRNPNERMGLMKDPGVPGNDLRRAGERLANKASKQSKKADLHTGHHGIFGSAGGMARVVAQRKEQEARRRDAQAMGGIAADLDGEEDAPVDPAVEERAKARKVSEMAAMALNATRKQVQHQEMDGMMNGDADGGTYAHDSKTHGGARTKDLSMRKFFKSFQRTLDSSDILLEVLDARDPLGCQLKKIEQTVESQFGDTKQIVIILNKADLVPDDVLQAWVEYFKNEENREFVVPFTAAKNSKSAIKAMDASEDEDDEHDDEAVGTGGSSMVGIQGRQAGIARLFSVLRKIARGEGGARKHVSVGVIGYPNVGKSSIINALKRKDVVGVGNTPGFTTGNTEVDLRNDVKILDCPGVVMPGEDTGDVVLRNAVKVDQLEDPLSAVERLCERCNLNDLATVYDVDPSTAERLRNAQQFVKAVGYRRGRVRQGGNVDEDETSRIILQDWNDGRIGYFTMPPDTNSVVPVNVQTLGRPDEEDDQQEESAGAVKVLTKLSTGFGVDGLPTFHLRATEAAQSSSKRRRGGNSGNHNRKREDEDFNPSGRRRI